MKRPNFGQLAGSTFDLVVIGGGINGAAIARDAALRGISVLLVEKNDFASGTTSWSTRLIHGGLRYLEHREFGLVRESLREREGLLRNGAHLVQPLPLHIPIYEHSKRGPWTIRAGMTLYDLLSWDKSLARHAMWSRDRALQAIPELDPAGLKGAARYFDAQATFPERLVMENLVDATASGAVALNYARVESLIIENLVTRGVVVTDVLTGAQSEIHCRSVLNVAGPWVDQILEHDRAGSPPRRLMGGTKGTHCFVAGRESIAPIYCETRSDQRPMFIIPWNGLTMIGTTDTRFSGDLDQVKATGQEIDYLITEAQALLPGAGFRRDDVLFSYAGIRPLPNSGVGAEAGITRKHFVVDHSPSQSGLYSVVGGKLTTHRSLAEHAVDTIAGYIGNTAPCQTVDRTLPGGSPGMLTNSSLSSGVRERLHSVWGSRAAALVTLAGDRPRLLESIVPGSDVIGAELLFAFEEEQATSLADALLRRMVAGFRPDLGRSLASAAARTGQEFLGWTAERAVSELADYERSLDRFAST